MDARWTILDPQLPTATPLGRRDSQLVRYDQRDITTGKGSITCVTLASFVTNFGPYNIVDWSADRGLQNNILYVNGTLVTVAPGSYDAVSLATALQTAVQVVVPTATVNYNALTYRFQFADAGAFRLSFGSSQTMAFELGFSNTYDATATVHTSTQNINLSGPSDILVTIPELPTANMLFYNLQPFIFSYPLTSASPYEGQLNMVTTPKLQARLNYAVTATSTLTVGLYFTRDGIIYPYYSPGTTGGSTVPGSYQMFLCFE